MPIRDRPRNAGRLVTVTQQLDRVADVADRKVTRPDMDQTRDPAWLFSLAAPTRQGTPSEALVRWRALFSNELKAVWRARNNVRWQWWISDENVAAAASMAERLLGLAETAGKLTAPRVPDVTLTAPEVFDHLVATADEPDEAPKLREVTRRIRPKDTGFVAELREQLRRDLREADRTRNND